MAGIFDSIEGALSNPLLQTALAGYLGAIGSPRYKGIGGAISQGGLSGLEAFSQAEQLKQQLPLMQAQTQKAQADVPYEQAQTKLATAQAGQLSGDPKLAAQMNMMANDPAFSPNSRAILKMLAPGVGAGKVKFEDAVKLAQTEDLDSARIAEAQAGTQQKLAEVGTYKSKIAEQEAATQKSTAEAGAVPSLIQYRQAEAAHAGEGSGHVTIHSIADPTKTMELPVPKGGAMEPPSGWEIGPGEKAPAPQTPGQQLGKVNTDLARFATTNPVHFYTNKQSWLNDAVQYLKNLNPGAPEEQLRQAAAAMARIPGPPSDATHEIVGPDGQVAGHRKADGTVQWLPGHEPGSSDALGATGITGG